MPQTKFVLKKALDLGLKVIVVINKIDKPGAQVQRTIDETTNLFLQLAIEEHRSRISRLACCRPAGQGVGRCACR